MLWALWHKNSALRAVAQRDRLFECILILRMTLQQAFDRALQFHMAGNLQQAEGIYRQILAVEPRHRDAMHLLGLLAHQVGQSAAAVELIRGAISLGLNTPDAYGNLGNALCGAGQFDEAIQAFRRSIALNPALAATYINLGNAHAAQGETDQAIAAFRQAADVDPKLPEAFNNLCSALNGAGELDEAIAAARRAIALRPGYCDALINLGNAFRFKGEFDEAIAAYQQALTANRPGSLPGPILAQVQSSVGSAHKDLGQAAQALAAYREAMRLDPADPRHGDNVLLTMQYDPACDAKTIAEENQKWNERYAMPLAKLAPAHANVRDPERRLRIGYVSADFKDHAVGRNLLPLFRRHDHRQFEIFCYSNASSTDAIACEFRQLADSFVNISHLSDEQAADRIASDRIDILVDLALHTAGNRLLVFARKPAPVQATFAGYPASTGLTAIDYRLSDPYLDSPDMDDSVYSERTIRLPDSFWCYDPLDCGDVPVSSLPALNAGVVTFGCLNNFCKINEDVLALWAEVLRQTDNSRLLLLTRSGRAYPRTLEQMQRAGIAADRIEFAQSGSRRTYLETYHRIDIGLDTFPYNGHTTSLDSLWMGVPVVTQIGSRSVARAGWCQLSNLGLTELAGESSEAFVSIAGRLANDLPRLSQLRSGLRRRMEESPVMDAPNFARGIEAAYRRMWRTWCETG